MSTMNSRVRTSAVLLFALSCLPGARAAEPERAQSASAAIVSTAAAPIPAPVVGSDGQAQEVPPTHVGIRTIVTAIVGDFRHLPSMTNLGAGIVGAGLSLAAHEVDDDVNRHLYGRGGVHTFFLPGKTIGQAPVLIGAAAATYAIGRVSDRPRVTHIGMDLLRADAVTGLLTIGLKEAVRRERPDGSSHGSFPSGHASMTFTTATVLARHFGWRAAVPTYLLASYVAASRLHENRHFLSDVVAGATLGYVAGRTVTRHGRSNFAMIPAVGRGTAAVVVSGAW